MPNTDGRIAPDAVMRGRMFLGTLDDSVSRNPWGFHRTSANSLTTTLIYHALLGPRLCSRIGNILYHPAYFKALLEGTTPLVALASTGFFQFHTKGGSFNESVELRLAEETNSTLAWVKDTGWSKHGGLYRRLDEIQALIGSQGRKQYSPSFHAAFQTLADRALASGTPEYQAVHARWSAMFPGRKRTRSEFEKLSLVMFEGDRQAQRAAMSTINSVNHYAYGLALGRLTQETREFPIIETSELMAMNALTRSLVDSGSTDPDHLREMMDKGVLDIVYDRLKFPADLFERPENWAVLAKLAGVDGSSEFLELKRGVLVAIRNTLEGKTSWLGPVELEKACAEYSRFLTRELGTRSSKLAAFSMKLKLPVITRVGAQNYAAGVLGGVILPVVTQGAVNPVTSGAISLFASVVIEMVTEPVRYRTRRIVDRVRMPSPSLRAYRNEVAPLAGALCIKAFQPDALKAAEDSALEAYLDSTAPDSF